MIPFLGFRIFTLVFLAIVCVDAQNLESLRWRTARSLEEQRKWDEAVNEYRAILLENPSLAEAYIRIGIIRQQQGNAGHALRNFQQALQLDSLLVNAWEGSAQAHTSLGEREKAIAAWRRIISLSTGETKVRAERKIAELLGTATNGQVNPGEVTAKVTVPSGTADTKSKFRYDALYKKATEEQQRGDCAAALATVRKLLQAQPGHPGAFYLGGVCRFNQGDMERAEFNFKRSLDYPEKGHNAHYYLGRIAERRNRPSEAITHYQRYLSLTKNQEGRAEAESRIRAISAQGVGALDAGADTATTLTTAGDQANRPELIDTLDGNLVVVLHKRQAAGGTELHRALEDARERRYNQAIEGFKQVRLRFPNTDNAQAAALNMVVLYKHLGLLDNARNLSTSLLRGEASGIYRNAFYWHHARSLVALQDLPAARRSLDSVVADTMLGPTRAAHLALGAELSAAQKDVKDAHLLLRQAIDAEQSPAKKASLRLRLAEHHRSRGERALAIRAWQELLDECKEVSDACRQAGYALADINYQGRNWTAALTYYERMVREYPDGEDAPWGLFQQGNIHRRQGRFKEAVAKFDAVQERFPDTYWAEQAKWSKEDAIWQERHGQVLRGPS